MVVLQIYTSDNGEVLLPPNWDNGGLNGTNTGWLYSLDLAATGTNRFKLTGGLFWETLRTPKVYLCPLDKTDESRFSATDGVVEQRPQQIASYSMNGAVIRFNARIYPPVKLTSLRPDDVAFWEPDEIDPHDFIDGASTPAWGVGHHHDPVAVQAAFDGFGKIHPLDRLGNRHCRRESQPALVLSEQPGRKMIRKPRLAGRVQAVQARPFQTYFHFALLAAWRFNE